MAAMKRTADEEDVEICEGAAAQWQAAASRKVRKIDQSSSPLQPLGGSQTNRRDVSVNQPYQISKSPLPQGSSQFDAPKRQARHACNCGNTENSATGYVECAAPECEVGIYHRKCVGLANRAWQTGWRCFSCRPKISAPTVLATSSSQCSTTLQSFSLSQNLPTEPTPNSSQVEQASLISHGPPEPPLHPEQEKVVQAIEHGYNVFYTGSAGTGKSTVLKAFVRRLKNQGKQVDIVAPSGIAALNVGGSTLFSYAYWHPDAFKDPLNVLIKKAHGKSVWKNLNKTDVLVIDEISMVERDMLVRLDALMREARHEWTPEFGSTKRKSLSPHSRNLPFGGAQVVVTGDFCQLPPVKPFRFCLQCGGEELPGYRAQDSRPLKCKKCPLVYNDGDKWAFRSKTWEDCKFSYFELKHIHRQSDEQFINILQKCRLGQSLLPSEKALLIAPKPDPVGAVKLLPMRREVDNENLRNFSNLKGSARTYDCLDVFSWRNKNEPELKKKGAPKYPEKPGGPLMALKDHRFEEKVHLKPGMLVILVVNLDFAAGLVNGSQGKIVRFEKYDPSKALVASSSRDSSPPPSGRRAFKGGSGGGEHAAFKEGQIREFIGKAAVQEWPVVQFYNGVTRTIPASCQLSELGSEKPYSILGRTQIPLLAARAITIHKSQGMTLDRVIVDLYSSFEREMVYVALSRARTLEGLKVVRLANVMERGVNEEVQQFLRTHFDESPSVPLPSIKATQACKDPLPHAVEIPPLVKTPPPGQNPFLVENPDPYEQWKTDVELAFKDYSSMQRFPCPPAFLVSCNKAVCQKNRQRALAACECNITAALERLGDLSKEERQRWNPIRFEQCAPERRKLFQKMAKEVFDVIHTMRVK